MTKVANLLVHGLYYNPVTMLLVAACLVVALLSGLGDNPEAVSGLFYPELDISAPLTNTDGISGPIIFLRTLTPIFLHFGAVHLIFNMLWLWYFGQQLERTQSSFIFLLLVFLFALIGNSAQYLFSGSTNFGGMSGVVYGLVGYIGVLNVFMPRSHIKLPIDMLIAFIIFLVVMAVIAGNSIANAAHMGGLFSGVLIGLAVASYYIFILNRDAVGHPPPQPNNNKQNHTDQMNPDETADSHSDSDDEWYRK
ncbi:MAG: rhomboid family intramembrane serine protease [Pseudohongiellaceae bacterium]